MGGSGGGGVGIVEFFAIALQQSVEFLAEVRNKNDGTEEEQT